MKNDRLTEENLKKLDDRILREAELRDKREDILDDRKSMRSTGSRARGGSVRPGTHASVRNGNNGLDIETRSVASSRMSGASKISKTSKHLEAPIQGK